MLPYKHAAALADHLPGPSWLIEGLWGEHAVGILGGEPKCCKSFLSLELAIAVASGGACLGKYPVHSPGPVLLYAAEDSAHIVKARLNGIAHARNQKLQNLNIQVITAEKLRLDQTADVESLDATIQAVRPRFLILDPFVRLHRIDENSSSEVAMILEHLRRMQRRHATSILIVHHAKKNGGTTRAGQALRGSSEFHAWGDSNLYMRRKGDRLMLTVEHRAAAGHNGIPLALREHAHGPALELEKDDPEQLKNQPKNTSDMRIAQVLARAPQPMPQYELRKATGLRAATLCDTLKVMIDAGQVLRNASGYVLANK